MNHNESEDDSPFFSFTYIWRAENILIPEQEIHFFRYFGT